MVRVGCSLRNHMVFPLNSHKEVWTLSKDDPYVGYGPQNKFVCCGQHFPWVNLSNVPGLGGLPPLVYLLLWSPEQLWIGNSNADTEIAQSEREPSVLTRRWSRKQQVRVQDRIIDQN